MTLLKSTKRCSCCEHWIQLESFDICPICSWQEEGQTDETASEIWGGANGDYSLSEARENFKKFKTMYRPSDARSKK